MRMRVTSVVCVYEGYECCLRCCLLCFASDFVRPDLAWNLHLLLQTLQNLQTLLQLKATEVTKVLCVIRAVLKPSKISKAFVSRTVYTSLRVGFVASKTKNLGKKLPNFSKWVSNTSFRVGFVASKTKNLGKKLPNFSKWVSNFRYR